MIRHAALSIAIAFFAGFAARQAMNPNRFAPADISDPFTHSHKRLQPVTASPTTRQIHEAQGELWKASQAIDRAYKHLDDAKAVNKN